MRHIILIATWSFAWLGSLPQSHAQENYDYRPFLFLDGKALADHAAAELCKNPQAFNFQEYDHHTPAYSALLGLYGFAFDHYANQADGARLESWILSQPDNSIDPLKLLQKSAELKNGNVLMALRLIYDLLTSEELQYSDELTPRAPPIRRAKRPLFQKLVDITGEQKIVQDKHASGKFPKVERGWGRLISPRGGKASSWYHFFGAAAVAYDEATKPTGLPLDCDMRAANAQIMGRVAAGGLVGLEMVFDLFAQAMTAKTFVGQRKRYVMNSQGVEFGAKLAHNMILASEQKNCDRLAKPQQHYLVDRPDIFGAHYPLKEDESPNQIRPGWLRDFNPFVPALKKDMDQKTN
ncbi:MAG: hypothetical protein AB7N80_09095 [Bdellovibrionales bacterium]